MWRVFTFLFLLIGTYLSAQTSYKLEVGINHATLTSINAYGNKPFFGLALSSTINRQTIFSHSFLYSIKGNESEDHHYLTWVPRFVFSPTEGIGLYAGGSFGLLLNRLLAINQDNLATTRNADVGFVAGVEVRLLNKLWIRGHLDRGLLDLTKGELSHRTYYNQNFQFGLVYLIKE